METSSDNFRLLNHFSFLVYPFLHNINRNNLEVKLKALESNWAPWWSRLNDEGLAQTLEGTYFFMPYIRSTLFPEISLLQEIKPGERYAKWAETIKGWVRQGNSAFCSAIPQDSIIRLTYLKDNSPFFKDSKVIQHREFKGKVVEHAEIPVSFDWFDVMLFPSGLGLMVLKVSLDGDSPQLSQLMDLNYYLRMVHPPSLDWTLPTLHFDCNKGIVMRDLMDFLTQGMTDYENSPFQELPTFQEELRKGTHGRYTESEPGQTLGERCQILSFACVDFQEAKVNQLLAGGFESPEDRILYEFATCMGLGDSINNRMWIPSKDQVEKLSNNRFAFWQCWRGMALKESSVFLATEDIHFNKTILPHNIENDYLPLYLFTFYQKLQLLVFSINLMGKGSQIERNLKDVQHLMEDFINFRNRFWFNEVTRKPMGGELYKKFQYGLEISALYDLLGSEVKDIQEYYERNYEKKISLFLNLFTFVFLPLGAVIGIFGMTFFVSSWKWFITSCVIVGITSFITWRLLTRS